MLWRCRRSLRMKRSCSLASGGPGSHHEASERPNWQPATRARSEEVPRSHSADQRIPQAAGRPMMANITRGGRTGGLVTSLSARSRTNEDEDQHPFAGSPVIMKLHGDDELDRATAIFWSPPTSTHCTVRQMSMSPSSSRQLRNSEIGDTHRGAIQAQYGADVSKAGETRAAVSTTSLAAKARKASTRVPRPSSIDKAVRGGARSIPETVDELSGASGIARTPKSVPRRKCSRFCCLSARRGAASAYPGRSTVPEWGAEPMDQLSATVLTLSLRAPVGERR